MIKEAPANKALTGGTVKKPPCPKCGKRDDLDICNGPYTHRVRCKRCDTRWVEAK